VVGRVDHAAVITRILEESGWSPRFAFMTMMSAGIAVLGLLLSSPAVVIGAMLISPLMNPILGLGFSLALFDFREMRRSVTALAVGAAAAVLFTALIVTFSPLKTATPEIIARTRPNLFDLLVALFAALAGTFALIRGRGDTIVGVAIATALMPPLATVGYGLATGNMAVAGGAGALFGTNLITIALSATIVARWYGFGHALSSQQTWTQTLVLLLVFVGLAVPLGWSLRRIAGEALTVSQARSFLTDRFGPQSRVTQLEIDFRHRPMSVRAVVIAPRSRGVPQGVLRSELAQALHRPLTGQIDEVLLDPNADALERQQAELEADTKPTPAPDPDGNAVRLLAALAGTNADAVTLDHDRQRAIVPAAVLPGAALAAYRGLETRARAALPGWDIQLIPPASTLPTVRFAKGSASLDKTASLAVQVSAWAATRWNYPVLAVPGLPSEAPAHPRLTQRRALAIQQLLRLEGMNATPAAAPAGASFVLGQIPSGT